MTVKKEILIVGRGLPAQPTMQTQLRAGKPRPYKIKNF